MEEIWKPISCVSNPRHEVSNLGRVRFLGRIYKNQFGNTITIKPNENVKGHTDNNGYTRFNFWDSEKGEYVSTTLHRLVANAFIPNPNNLPFINHKDENPHNNAVPNLEWCDCAYNNNYGTAKKRASITRSKRGVSKRVDVYRVNGEFVRSFISIYEASNNLGIAAGNISKSCMIKSRTHKGYVFRYGGEPFDYERLANREVSVLDIMSKGRVIHRAFGTTDASKFLNIKRSCMKGKLHRFHSKGKPMTCGIYNIIEVGVCRVDDMRKEVLAL